MHRKFGKPVTIYGEDQNAFGGGITWVSETPFKLTIGTILEYLKAWEQYNTPEQKKLRRKYEPWSEESKSAAAAEAAAEVAAQAAAEVAAQAAEADAQAAEADAQAAKAADETDEHAPLLGMRRRTNMPKSCFA